MISRSHYDVLGVKEDASTTEIKSAYHQKIRVHHPDKNADQTADAISIIEAYKILIDPKERKKYDASLKNPAPAPLKTHVEPVFNKDVTIALEKEYRNKGLTDLADALLDELQRHTQPVPSKLTPSRSYIKTIAKEYGLEDVTALNEEQDDIRAELIRAIKDVIWALNFEPGPISEEYLNYSRPEFFPVSCTGPLSWQKIIVATGPSNDDMYCVLKAALQSLFTLNSEILPYTKKMYPKYDQINTDNCIHESDYNYLMYKIGNLPLTPGVLVTQVVEKVEGKLSLLCEVRNQFGYS